MEKVWLACVQRYPLNLSYKRMLRHRSALKKKINLSFMEKKKNLDCADITKIKDEKIQIFLLNVINMCACDIAGCALSTLNLWRKPLPTNSDIYCIQFLQVPEVSQHVLPRKIEPEKM